MSETPNRSRALEEGSRRFTELKARQSRRKRCTTSANGVPTIGTPRRSPRSSAVGRGGHSASGRAFRTRRRRPWPQGRSAGSPPWVPGVDSDAPKGPARVWCGRPDSNRHEPRGPTDFRTTSAFAAAGRRSWSGLSLRPSPKAVGAARLVSTPSQENPPGLGSGFPSDRVPRI